jgi:cold shock CspA family protein
MNGTINAGIVARGFGFVMAEDGHEFFHRSALARPLVLDRLVVGQSVRFIVGPGPNGPHIVRLRPGPTQAP